VQITAAYAPAAHVGSEAEVKEWVKALDAATASDALAVLAADIGCGRPRAGAIPSCFVGNSPW
jgi:hypothetical protein